MNRTQLVALAVIFLLWIGSPISASPPEQAVPANPMAAAPAPPQELVDRVNESLTRLHTGEAPFDWRGLAEDYPAEQIRAAVSKVIDNHPAMRFDGDNRLLLIIKDAGVFDFDSMSDAIVMLPLDAPPFGGGFVGRPGIKVRDARFTDTGVEVIASVNGVEDTHILPWEPGYAPRNFRREPDGRMLIEGDKKLLKLDDLRDPDGGPAYKDIHEEMSLDAFLKSDTVCLLRRLCTFRILGEKITIISGHFTPQWEEMWFIFGKSSLVPEPVLLGVVKPPRPDMMRVTMENGLEMPVEKPVDRNKVLERVGAGKRFGSIREAYEAGHAATLRMAGGMGRPTEHIDGVIEENRQEILQWAAIDDPKTLNGNHPYWTVELGMTPAEVTETLGMTPTRTLDDGATIIYGQDTVPGENVSRLGNWIVVDFAEVGGERQLIGLYAHDFVDRRLLPEPKRPDNAPPK